MSQRVALALAAITGVVGGALLTVSLQSPALEPLPGPTTPTATSPPAPAPTSPAATSRAVPDEPVDTLPARQLLLVWTAGGLPDGLADEVAALPTVERVTSVAGATVDLVASRTAAGTPVDEPADGWAIPLDALAIDAGDYAPFVPPADEDTVASLGPGRALLGSTSAELRGLAVGDVLTVSGGAELTVHGIVEDTLVGGAEVVVTRGDGLAIGITTDRFLLVAHQGDRSALESAVRELAGTEVRVRGPGETPYLRHGDAVLPQALIKARFGEFAYRPVPGGDGLIVQDPAWEAAHVVTAEVPILGSVRCHRNVIAQLRGALEELQARGLGHLIDPATYAGCHHPRFIATGTGLSRHSWGIAVDLNAEDNPTGQGSGQDRRLVDTFRRWGFTWGGFWLVPDPMHLEWVGPPEARAAKVVTDGG